MKKLCIALLLCSPLMINAMGVNAKLKNLSVSLTFSAEVGNIEDVKKRLEAGEDINQTDNEGFAALYIACAYNQPKIALLLLKNDADPNIISDFSPSTSLNNARKAGMDDVVKALLKAGADENLKGLSDKNPNDS